MVKDVQIGASAGPWPPMSSDFSNLIGTVWLGQLCQQIFSEQMFEVICGCHGKQALVVTGLIGSLGRRKSCPFVTEFYGV